MEEVKLRQSFIGYFPPNDQELEELFDSALVILDTNSLLNLYRYKVEVRNLFMKMLEQFKERLWLPHRVAVEFHRRRVDVIREQQEAVGKISKLLEDTASSLAGQLSGFARNPIVDIDPIVEHVKATVAELRKRVDEAGHRSDAQFGVTPQKDATLIAIADLYSGRVGDALSNDEMEALHKEGEYRYTNRIAPGFRDAGKDGVDKYGDLIIWKQILRHAAAIEKPVLFLTDDNKDDWWWKSNGETLGPLPELREEFSRETGQLFYMYRPYFFLDLLQKRGRFTISRDVVRQVEETSQISNDREEERIEAELIRMAAADRRYKIHKQQILVELNAIEDEIRHVAQTISALNKRLANSSGNRQEVIHLRSRIDELLHQENDLLMQAGSTSTKDRDRILRRAEDARRHRKALELSIATVRSALDESEETKMRLAALEAQLERLRLRRAVLNQQVHQDHRMPLTLDISMDEQDDDDQ